MRPSVAVIGVNAFGIHIANILKMRKMAGVRYYMAIGDDTDDLHKSTADTKIYLAPHSELAIQQLGKDEMIERACQRASVTCELTGTPGRLCHLDSPKDQSLLHGGPYIVLCPEKAEEFEYVACEKAAP